MGPEWPKGVPRDRGHLLEAVILSTVACSVVFDTKSRKIKRTGSVGGNACQKTFFLLSGADLKDEGGGAWGGVDYSIPQHLSCIWSIAGRI